MMTPTRRFLLALAMLAAVLVVSIARVRAPRPKPATAPRSEFSAERAVALLSALLGDGRPHPVMSAANRAVRERIVARLVALGYQPEIQRKFVCREYVSCATVENIIAVHPGTSNGNAVVLAVHYDSVPAGPGASDDGAGVAAALEIARIVRAEHHRNPIAFLIDDGEEAGLLGAAAFLEHPLAKRTGAIVNLEARGTEGASFMFETSRHNRWIVARMGESVARPSASSLYYSIYKRLPNDTDLTVFKAGGLAGMNFGFIGGATRYHTPLDDLAHASRASLQHHGDNALAMVRALADADLSGLPEGESVYFDLLQLGIVSWPVEWNWPLVALGAAAIGFAMRRLRSRPSSIILGFIGWLGTFLGGLALGLGGAWILKRGGAFPSQWVAHPAAAVAWFWIAGFGAALLFAILLGRRAGFDGLWSGAALGWLLLAAISSALLPGAAYLFLPVALAFGWPRAVMLPSLVAAVIVFPTAVPLYDAMGLTLMPIVSLIIAALAAIPAALLAETSARVRLAAIAFAGVGLLVLLGVALTREPYSAENPRRLNIAYRIDADRATRQWTAGAEQPLPPSLERAARWSRAIDPVTGASLFAAEAKGPMLPLPSVALLSDEPVHEGRRLKLAVRPGRGAPRVNLVLREAKRFTALRVGDAGIGTPMAEEARWVEPGALRIALRFDDDGEIPIEILARDREPVEGYVEELSFGLPAEAAALVRARPAWAVPSQNGDVTVVTRRVRF